MAFARTPPLTRLDDTGAPFNSTRCFLVNVDGRNRANVLVFVSFLVVQVFLLHNILLAAVRKSCRAGNEAAARGLNVRQRRQVVKADVHLRLDSFSFRFEAREPFLPLQTSPSITLSLQR